MAKTVASAFEEFDEALKLDPAERQRAQERHREITDRLVEAGLAASTFLQGSFARKTMLKSLKDVDMIIILTEAHRPAWGADGCGGPAAAMAAIEKVIAETFPGARFDVTASPPHALQVVFPDCPFTFDLVPAFADPDGGEDADIADRKEDRWERSNVRTLNRVISERNQATLGVFVHQVRMAKSFKRDHPQLGDLDGLVMESLAHAVIVKKMPHDQALVALLTHAASAVFGVVLDPTGVEDLAADWTSAQRATYHVGFQRAADRGAEALALVAEGDHPSAIEIWHDLLGEPFPQAAPATEAQTLNGLVSGSITSTGRAVSSRHGAQPNRPARSWRIR